MSLDPTTIAAIVDFLTAHFGATGAAIVVVIAAVGLLASWLLASLQGLLAVLQKLKIMGDAPAWVTKVFALLNFLGNNFSQVHPATQPTIAPKKP